MPGEAPSTFCGCACKAPQSEETGQEERSRRQQADRLAVIVACVVHGRPCLSWWRRSARAVGQHALAVGAQVGGGVAREVAAAGRPAWRWQSPTRPSWLRTYCTALWFTSTPFSVAFSCRSSAMATACGVAPAALDRRDRLAHRGAGRHHVVDDQHAALERRAHQVAAFAVRPWLPCGCRRRGTLRPRRASSAATVAPSGMPL